MAVPGDKAWVIRRTGAPFAANGPSEKATATVAAKAFTSHVIDLAGKGALLASRKYHPGVSERQTSRLNEILTNAGVSVMLHVHEGGHELGNTMLTLPAGELAGLETLD